MIDLGSLNGLELMIEDDGLGQGTEVSMLLARAGRCQEHGQEGEKSRTKSEVGKET